MLLDPAKSLSRYPIGGKLTERHIIGTVPADAINTTWDGIEAEQKDVWLSYMMHEKVATKHAADYDICMRHKELCLEAPTYIGFHPKHPGVVELIRRVPSRRAVVLVAVALVPNDSGNYSVASMYCVSEKRVEQYRDAGWLRPTKQKPRE